MSSALTGIDNERVALVDVSVSAVLNDLLSEVTITQTYRNDEAVNIEAVYTFPLPLDAVLLELQVEIGERTLEGVVVEKSEAEEQYEDAVAEGDAAIMLATIEPGLYTMHVGNLLPKETARITYKYSILYRWTGDRFRVFLPTTVAPRYGKWRHRPHETPEVGLVVENRFSLQLEIFGALRDARFECPSHLVTLAKSAEKAVLSLQQQRAIMDRDFVLNVTAPQAARSFVLSGVDGDGVAVLASFQPFLPGLRQSHPLNLAIVIDCSDSMAGDSINQAKEALERILTGLQPHDRMTIIAFGSTVKPMSRALFACSKVNLGRAATYAGQLDADMGGTEIGRALDKAYEMLRGVEAADIFLLTDGEVTDREAVVRAGEKAGHRIFTVGVGSAVSEAFVRQLASTTGGACEMVSPREEMAERVVRHFERMRAARARRAMIRWPEGAVGLAPTDVGPIFEGDTVLACARFDSRQPVGPIVLEVEADTDDLVRQELTLTARPFEATTESMSTVARVTAALRLRQSDMASGLDLALRYRLLSPWTNWLVVAAREAGEKTEGLPELRKVRHTLAAGWGGSGSVRAKSRGAHILYSHDIGDDIPLSAASEVRQEPIDWSRLSSLVNADPSMLQVEEALALLRESGTADRFHEVFELAQELAVDSNAIAVIIVSIVLGGPAGIDLSAQANDALASLRTVARRSLAALLQMARDGQALERAVWRAIERDVLGSFQAGGTKDGLERYTRIGDLIERLKLALRESAVGAGEGVGSVQTSE